jgi:hypothetical protein
MPELRLEIDPLHLADEWLLQPLQRRAWGEQLADAQLELDEAKSNLSVAQAEADREIRENPSDHGLAKVTEASISTAVTVDPFVKKAVERVNKARHRVNVVQAAVDGLEHRKRALSMLCELHGQDYYATPKMPPGIKTRRREREDADADD